MTILLYQTLIILLIRYYTMLRHNSITSIYSHPYHHIHIEECPATSLKAGDVISYVHIHRLGVKPGLGRGRSF